MTDRQAVEYRTASAPRAPRRLPAWMPRSNFAIFALLFACWVLVDMTLLRWLSKYAFVIAAPLAAAVILRPNNARLFVALAAASLWAYWLKMPFYTNVVLCGAVFSVIILLATLNTLLRHRRLPLSQDELEAICFPAIRVAVPVVWLFAVLHKTNQAFLDPHISCAVQHYNNLRRYLPILPASETNEIVGHCAVWTAWCFEISVPVFLILGTVLRAPRFLIVGTTLALGFHFVMAVNGYQNFSALGLAFYVPYLPKTFWRTLAAGIMNVLRSSVGHFYGVVIKLAAVGMTLFAVELMGYSILKIIRSNPRWPLETSLTMQGWLFVSFLLSPVMIFGWVWLMWQRRRRAYELSPGRMPLWAYPVFAVVVLNGLCPYLGLKTENSFAMFSNLLTEGEHWNHSFLPKSMQVFGFQDRMVTVHRFVIEGEDPARTKARRDEAGDLAELAAVDDSGKAKFRVVEFEFKRLLADACDKVKKPIAVTYDINGEKHQVADVHQVPALANGNPAWQAKIFFFRWVPNEPRGICLH